MAAYLLLAPENFYAVAPSGSYDYFDSAEAASAWAKGKKGARVYQLPSGWGVEYDGSNGKLLMSTNGLRKKRRRARA